MKEVYLVSLERPRGVTKTAMAAYIKTAIDSWKGGGDPENPIWELPPVDVKPRARVLPAAESAPF